MNGKLESPDEEGAAATAEGLSRGDPLAAEGAGLVGLRHWNTGAEARSRAEPLGDEGEAPRTGVGTNAGRGAQ